MAFSPAGRDPLTASDGLQLHTQHWDAESPAATVVLVHGYAEHCGRYGHVAHPLVNEGASVFAYDQRGHGRSEGRRAYVDSFDDYLDDLGRILDHVRTRPELPAPLFLFGHSMGGLVALKYVLDRSPAVHGLILSAPAIEINPDLAPLLRTIAQVLGRLVPTLPTTRSPQGAISRDPEVVEEAEQDPLNYHGRVPARTGAEMLRTGAEVRDRLDALRTPFLLFHGTADTLTNPEWSKRLYERAAADDKTLHLYDGLYHETFNEPERETVLSDLAAWIRPRIGTQ